MVVLGLSVFSASVFAQQPVVQPPNVRATEIEEVLVTALRRTRPLFGVPDAITVFDRDEIERSGIARLNDVARMTPNLRFSDDQEVGVGTITIRGVTQNRGIGETPVAFIVDGVAVNNSLVTTQDLFDVEQIEVLRGPQGALHGRNAVAGTINIRTIQPTSRLSGYSRLRASEGSDYTFQGAVSNGFLDDKLRLRLAGYWQERKGQLHNETIGRDVDFKDSVGVRLRAIYEAGSGTIDFRFQHSDQEGGSGYFMPGSADTEENRLPGDPFPYPLNNSTFSIQSNLRGVSDVFFNEYTLKFDWAFPSFQFTSISGYNHLESNNDQDLDQTAREFLNILVNDDANHLSQDLRFTSVSDGPWQWIAGAYYSDQERDRSLATFLNVAGFSNGGNWGSDAAWFVPQPPAVLSERYQTKALYGQLDYAIDSHWSLMLSSRYDRVRRRNDSSNPATNGTASFSKLQPKIQLAYTPLENLGFFATYSKGFRPGGFNTVAPAPEVQFSAQFESETLTNQELGIRYRQPDGAWSLSAAAFQIDYDDQQFFLFDPFGSQALINADQSRIRGGEIEATWQASDRWQLAGSYGFVDSEIQALSSQPGLDVPIEEIVGRDVPNAPVYSLNVAASYSRVLGGLDWNARAEYELRGRTWFTIDGLHSQAPYDLINLRGGVAGSNWRLEAFVKNLLDEEWVEFYFSRRFIGLRTDIAWPSPKRMGGIEVSWMF